MIRRDEEEDEKKTSGTVEVTEGKKWTDRAVVKEDRYCSFFVDLSRVCQLFSFCSSKSFSSLFFKRVWASKGPPNEYTSECQSSRLRLYLSEDFV